MANGFETELRPYQGGWPTQGTWESVNEQTPQLQSPMGAFQRWLQEKMPPSVAESLLAYIGGWEPQQQTRLEEMTNAAAGSTGSLSNAIKAEGPLVAVGRSRRLLPSGESVPTEGSEVVQNLANRAWRALPERFKAIIREGGPVAVKEDPQLSFLGVYNPYSKAIVVNPAQVQKYPDVLAHEAVHRVQDLRTGLFEETPGFKLTPRRVRDYMAAGADPTGEGLAHAMTSYEAKHLEQPTTWGGIQEALDAIERQFPAKSPNPQAALRIAQTKRQALLRSESQQITPADLRAEQMQRLLKLQDAAQRGRYIKPIETPAEFAEALRRTNNRAASPAENVVRQLEMQYPPRAKKGPRVGGNAPSVRTTPVSSTSPLAAISPGIQEAMSARLDQPFEQFQKSFPAATREMYDALKQKFAMPKGE